MVFLSAFLFALLTFVIPGELLLVWLADWIAAKFSLPAQVVLGALNFLVFAGCLCLLRFTAIVWRDFSWEKGVINEQLREFLDIRHCRWLPLLAFVGVAACVVQLVIAGLLPFPFWFLFAAILIGLFDIFGRRHLVTIPLVLPEPVFEFEEPRREGGEGLREIELSWERPANGPARRRAETCSEIFYVSAAEYEEASGRERFQKRPLSHYARYVLEGSGDSVREIASWLRSDAEANRYTGFEEFMNSIQIVRGIPYKSDKETHGVDDYANFPIETLWEIAGDCEDHAILAVALAHSLGHDAALFWIDLDDSAHLALGFCPRDGNYSGVAPFALQASNGRRYMYVETVPTSADSMPGDISEEFMSQLEQGEVILIEKQP